MDTKCRFASLDPADSSCRLPPVAVLIGEQLSTMVSTHQPHNCSNYTPTPARPAPATAMAAELLSPLLPRRRRGLAVAAAAPLLALLLVAVIFFRAPLTTTVSSPERVDLTLVAGAREKGAGNKSPSCSLSSFLSVPDV